MITTAVHQASQMVEIQGAAPAAPASGDDFRATFAASVGDAATQKPAVTSAQTALATASSKHLLSTGISAKTSPLAKSGALEDSQKLKDADSGEIAVGAESEMETPADPSTVSAGSLKSEAVENWSASAGPASTALAVAAIPLQSANADSTRLQAAVAASGLGSIAGSAKDTETTQAITVHGRKELTAASTKDAGAASASRAVPSATSAAGGLLQTATVAAPVVQLDMPTIVKPRTPDGGSIAEGGTKRGVLTSVLAAGDGASGFHGSPVRPANGDLPDAAPGIDSGLSELASLQEGTSAGTVATAGSGRFSKTVSADEAAAAGVGAKGAPENDPIVAEVQTASSEGVSATAASIAAASPGAIEANLKSVAGAAQAKSVSAVNSASLKTTFSMGMAEAASVTQARAIAQPHPVSGAQARAASQTAVSKTAGTMTAQLAGSEGRDAARGAVPTNAVDAAVAVGGPPMAASVEVKLAAQADAVRDAAAGAAPLTEASSRTGVAATKDEKSKSVSAGVDDTASARAAAQSGAGDTSNAIGNVAGSAAGSVSANFATGAPNLAGRVVASADAAVPSAQATVHLAGATAHDVAAAVGPGASVRSLGSVNAGSGGAGSVAEQTSSLATPAEPHRTLLATPTALEVGVPSGTQGWLRIRAEVGAPGEVNASLSAASSGGRDLLHSQMPALNAFLHSEQLAVTATVAERGTVAAGGNHGGAAPGSGGLGSGGLGSGGLGSDASGGSNASLLQGGGAQTGGGQRETGHVTGSDLMTSYDGRAGGSDASGTLPGSNGISEESGRWLNVRV